MKLTRNMDKRIVVSIILLFFAVLLTFSLIKLSKKSQSLKYELSELNGIQYGLLNINEWEGKLATILTTQIKEFELTNENRNKLSKSIENVLYKVLDEVEILMEKRTSGGLSIIKKWAAGMALDVEQLRDSVPEISMKLLEEINKPESKKVIKSYLITKLDEFTEKTYNAVNLGSVDYIVEKYGCISKLECNDLLKLKINSYNSLVNFHVITILVLVTLVFIILLFPIRSFDKTKLNLLIISVLCLLMGGLMTPMIDLEASIDTLTFKLLDHPIVFSNQVFFFQSKSITDVVWVLLSYGSIQMSTVAILVFSFSIVFPVLKLFSSFVYYSQFSKWKNNSIIKFFALKSGKWSMADVMVVAIFMSYISLNGIIDNQLYLLAEAAKPVEIITTNGTVLLGGFYLFFFFCIYGLVISQVISKSK